jgi:hypothetical protein
MNIAMLPLEEIRDENDRLIAKGQVCAYVQSYALAFGFDSDVWVEVNPFENMDNGEVGYVDSVLELPDGSRWLVEDKTTSRFEDAETLAMALRMDDQIATYALAFADQGIKLAGVKYRQVLKTLLRQKKTETLQEYVERVGEVYQSEPGTYCREIQIIFNDDDLKTWRVQKDRENLDIIQYFDRYDLAEWPFNGSSCISAYGPCEFLGLCNNPCDTSKNFTENGKEPLDGGIFKTKIWKSTGSIPIPETDAELFRRDTANTKGEANAAAL